MTKSIVEIIISDLAFGGKSVGKIQTASGGQMVIFVSGAVPGDKILARITKMKKSYAEAVIEKIIEPSPERQPARCKHFGVCGGCSLQFLDYKNQLKWKGKMVADALKNIGGFSGVAVEPIIGCESPWFYRNKMEYSFGENGKLGLHPARNFREVFDLEECFLQSELSVKIAGAVRLWAKENNLNTGTLRNLIVREGKNTNETMVNLVTRGENFQLEKEFAQFISENFQQITSLYRTAVTVRRGFKTVTKEFHLSGKKCLTETLNIAGQRLLFEIAPQAFFQPNTHQAEILYGKILEFAEPKTSDTVLDLFCGTGTIGLFFAKICEKVLGYELNSSAIESAQSNAVSNKITNAEFICGDIGKTLTRLSPSILITDPPRAGIEPKPLQKIIALKAPKWIYVSCNPTTLARDLKIICENGYKIQRIQPVDMFPHTYHIETVCLLETH